MKKGLLFRLFSLMLVCSFLVQPGTEIQASSRASASAQTHPADTHYEPGVVIVKFKSTATDQLTAHINTQQTVFDSILAQVGAVASEPFLTPFAATPSDMPEFAQNMFILNIPENQDVMATIKTLEALPEVEYAQPNFYLTLDEVPNDPDYSRQWGLGVINAPATWDQTHGDASIAVAVIDSGANFTHPDLADKLIAGWDYVEGDAFPQDDWGHGTHVAGIIAAQPNNGIGVAGVGWNTRVFVQRVCRGFGLSCPTDDIVKAIIVASDNIYVRVINLSLGGYDYNQAMDDAVQDAYKKGKTIVASAGNDNTDRPYYPASYDHVISVAALNKYIVRANFSNYGKSTDLSAPGVDIYSTALYGLFSPNGYESREGTSQAAPFVSGTAALLYAALPPDRRSPDIVEKILTASATDIGVPGKDNYYGWGVVNASNALDMALYPPQLSIKVWHYTAHDVPARNQYTVKVRNHTNHVLAYENTVTIPPSASDLSLKLFGVPDGNYDIYLYNSPFLSRVYENATLTGGAVTSVDFSEKGVYGDFNRDDENNIVDFILFVRSYQKINWEMDQDGNDIINITDFIFFARGYQKRGAEFAYANTLPTDVIASSLSQNMQALQTGGGVYFLPANGSFPVDSEFDVQVQLDTGGMTVGGANINLRYDSCALEALSVSYGTLFGGNQGLGYNIFPERGEILISDGSMSQTFNGLGTLMTVRFKAKSAISQTGVWVYLKQGATNDSNIGDSETSNDILTWVGHAGFTITGSPAREAVVGTLTPSWGSMVSDYQVPYDLALTGCSQVVADSVTFEAFYNGGWHTLSEDRNNNNGWDGNWLTTGIPGQVIKIRATIADINQHTTLIEATNINLDHQSPTTLIALPSKIPVNNVINILWKSTDDVSGVKRVYVEYKDGPNGVWQSWVNDSNARGGAELSVSPNHLYYFRIRAEDYAGNISSYSERVVGATVIYLPVTLKK